ncbi:hypothetical protein AWM70_12300 [Paenibacillus yonginensis]|uniref:PRTase-CE domain-containing protein n=1 Tax=Paenibacillus yonginensis TaxID=1462996 RepID=A0A1B1N1H7_9BACL|nr:hypothetical protein [Paenibacillus yonginensis]ANS75290.1 hypothetical protein AWM70_12300 [Paenibacillus yonginensis]
MNRRSEKSNRSLSIEILTRLSQIFNSKSWEIENDNPEQPSLFNRYCSLLSDLTESEQSLILELTERFTRISSNQYSYHIKQIVDQLAQDPRFNLAQISNIFIAPLISPEDLKLGKVKSSLMVQYAFPEQLAYNMYFSNKNISFVTGLNADSSNINNDSSLLLVVDDFIGSGDTACSALNYLLHDKKISRDKMIVASIVALNQGITKISELGVQVVSSLTFFKGISEHYSLEDRVGKLTLMDEIERKIKVHENEKLGYGQSEALVSMIRTPNNTFPVFWKEKKGRVAPFPRKNF